MNATTTTAATAAAAGRTNAVASDETYDVVPAALIGRTAAAATATNTPSGVVLLYDLVPPELIGIDTEATAAAATTALGRGTRCATSSASAA